MGTFSSRTQPTPPPLLLAPAKPLTCGPGRTICSARRHKLAEAYSLLVSLFLRSNSKESERQTPAVGSFSAELGPSHSAPMARPSYQNAMVFGASEASGSYATSSSMPSSSYSANSEWARPTSRSGPPSPPGRHPYQSGPPAHLPSYYPPPPLGRSSSSYGLGRGHGMTRGRSWETDSGPGSSGGSSRDRTRFSEDSPRSWDGDRLAEQPILIGQGTAPRPPVLSSSGRWTAEPNPWSERAHSWAAVDGPRSSQHGQPTSPTGTLSDSSIHLSPASYGSSTGLPRERAGEVTLPSFREFILASTDEPDPHRSSAYSPLSAPSHLAQTHGSSHSSHSSPTSGSALKRKHPSDDGRPMSAASRMSPPRLSSSYSHSSSGLSLAPLHRVAESSSSSALDDHPAGRSLSARYPRPGSATFLRPETRPRSQSNVGPAAPSTPSLVSSHSYSTQRTTTGPSSPRDNSGWASVQGREVEEVKQELDRAPISWGKVPDE